MEYTSVVIGYAPKAKELAAAATEKCNEMANDGWELAAMTVTGSAKAILMFKRPRTAAGTQEE